MNYEVVSAITVVTLGMLLGVWGASLVVRAMASRASRIALRLARRIPRRINTAPPQLSLLQFWFGVIVGPIACLAGTTLCVFVIGVVALDGEPFRWSAVPPIMLVIFAAGALAVGFRWDRARGRRRCPKCWYDYTGLSDAAACPECGRVPTSPRALARTRRCRAIMLAAPVLLLAAWLTHITPIAMQTSWRAFVPTTVLIGFYEYMPDTLISASPPGNASLDDRLQYGRMTLWQERWLGRRAARMLTTSDPRTCAYSAYFANWADDESVFPDPDAITANLLRVGFTAAASSDPRVNTHARALLMQQMFTPGPKSRAEFENNRAFALSRFQNPVGIFDHITYGRLIGLFAEPDDEVVAAVRGVALDPQWQADRRDQAAALLGMLASRSPSLRERLEAEYPASQGNVRTMLALAMMSARVQRAFPETVKRYTHSDPAVERENSATLGTFMQHPDADIRRAAAMVPYAAPRLTAPLYDFTQTHQDLAKLAKSDRASAAFAVRSLAWSGGIPDEVVPVIAAVLETGSTDEVAAVAMILRWQQMDRDWIALRGPLNTRVNDATLDQPTRTALAAAKAELDAKVPPAPETTDQESATPQ